MQRAAGLVNFYDIRTALRKLVPELSNGALHQSGVIARGIIANTVGKRNIGDVDTRPLSRVDRLDGVIQTLPRIYLRHSHTALRLIMRLKQRESAIRNEFERYDRAVQCRGMECSGLTCRLSVLSTSFS